MRVKSFLVVLLLAVIIAVPAIAKESTDEQIEKLQQQIDELKAHTYVKAKFPVELYGFIAAQFFEGTARTQLYGGLNSVAGQSRVVNKTTAGGGRHTWFGATPQNSRVGLNWKGGKVSEKVSIGGLLELDFVNILNSTAYGTSPIPRIRHFYGELSSSDNWSLIFGQTWDIFSPLNTSSLSLGNNLWYQGNMGFRRPQLRFTYNFPIDDVNKIKIAASANHPANTDDLMNGGVSAGFPHGEALVQYTRKMKYGDFIIAASGVAGATNNGSTYAKIAGIAGSVAVPFHKYLKLSGEVHYGQDLGNYLSYVGTGNKNRNLAVWGQIASRWHEKFDTAVGYGIDDIRSSKVTTGNVDRNQVAFANFRFFPVKPFWFGIEYNYMRTHYKDNGTSPANVVFSNLVYNF